MNIVSIVNQTNPIKALRSPEPTWKWNIVDAMAPCETMFLLRDQGVNCHLSSERRFFETTETVAMW